jgi:hypothetical protein
MEAPVVQKKKEGKKQTFLVERVQTGVRLEKRLLKVLKALAEYYDIICWKASSCTLLTGNARSAASRSAVLRISNAFTDWSWTPRRATACRSEDRRTRKDWREEQWLTQY